MQIKNEDFEQNFAPIKCRILQIIEYKGVKRDKFFNEICVAKSNFSKSAGRSEVSASVCAKILNYFNDINADWLLTGNGSMLKTDFSNNSGIIQNESTGCHASITTDHSKEENDRCKMCKEKDLQIEDLKERIEGLKERINDQKEHIEELNNRISSLKEQLRGG